MSLLQEWRDYAYAKDTTKREEKLFWENYFNVEKEIYKKLLQAPDKIISGTVRQLAEQYQIELNYMVGFLDGINESLKQQNPIEEMKEDTVVTLDIDVEKLYYNMVAAKADWLYNLSEWDSILTEEKRKELYLKQKKSGTIRKQKKIGRNDLCPCGSGKKYKYCCGVNE